MKRGIYYTSAVACALLFAVFTLVVRANVLDRFDFDATVKIQNVVPLRFDTFLSLFSLLGSFEIILMVLFIIAAFSYKNRLFIASVFSGFVLVHVLEVIGKWMLFHPGPPFLFHRTYSFLLFPSSYVHTNGAYPSGHSLRSTFIITIFIALIARSRLSPLKKYIAYALLVALLVIALISRVSLGEHWTTDVIGGTLLGLCAASMSIGLLRRA